ncbi:MAG: hypothetical protein AAFQ41_16370 [Cyanobacteria bacterium J06623_7]
MAILIGNVLPQFMLQIILSLISFIFSAINNLLTLLSPFILLLPIPIVAFAHHYLYLLLDRFYPDLDSHERGRVTGYIPGIASWWHGLFTLVVVIMAMLVSDSVLSILPIISSSQTTCSGLPQILDPGVYGAMQVLPHGIIHGTLHGAMPATELCAASSRVGMWVQIAIAILGKPIFSPLLRLLIWLVSAAYIYQFEFIFREHLITMATESDR